MRRNCRQQTGQTNGPVSVIYTVVTTAIRVRFVGRSTLASPRFDKCRPTAAAAADDKFVSPLLFLKSRAFYYIKNTTSSRSSDVGRQTTPLSLRCLRNRLDPYRNRIMVVSCSRSITACSECRLVGRQIVLTNRSNLSADKNFVG